MSSATPLKFRFSMNRMLAIALICSAPAASAICQSSRAALAPSDAAQLRDQYATDLDSVHAKISALATAIPAEKYSWRPAPGVRSVSEVLMHLSGEWYFYCPRSIGSTEPANFGDPHAKLAALEKVVTKEKVLAQMKESWSYCKAQLAGADPAMLTAKYKPWNITLGDAAFSMTGDQHEHLGQLIAYARSIGVKPPWSK
ncbi:MAG TPA: DinB family protein [Gemmatimonadaceae bacterium]